MSTLNIVESFSSQKEFDTFKAFIQELINCGTLVELAIDERDPYHIIQILKDVKGTTWLFAHPDQAFRGFFKPSDLVPIRN